MNICYTMKLKNIPIVDVVILCMGYIIRVIYGAELIDVVVSNWLYLTILSIAFYMGLGKRRNELINVNENNSRKVLKYYSKSFLDNNMYMFMNLVIVFYALWCIEMANENIIWTVCLVIIICIRYSYNLEKDFIDDPIEIILSDKVILSLAMILAIALTLILYI